MYLTAGRDTVNSGGGTEDETFDAEIMTKFEELQGISGVVAVILQGVTH